MNSFLNSALSLRRRSVWEAADSGVLLWRSNFGYFILFFAIPVWVIACLLRLLPVDLKFLSYLVLWWLKPLFDRMVLHVVSRMFFGAGDKSRISERAGSVQVSRRSIILRRRLGRDLSRGLFGDLLWRRFSPSRGALMPIRVLERLGGKQFRLRKKALSAGGLNFCIVISILGIMAEALLLLGEVIFVLIMLQMFSPAAFSYLWDNPENLEFFIFAAFCFNFILAESLYVCMGFGLYISSRVEVEGWDLQILFQKFAASEKPNPAPAAKKIFLAVFFLGLLFGMLAPALNAVAEEGEESGEYFPEGFPFAGEDALERLNEILSSGDFGYETDSWGIRLKQSGKRTETPEIKFPPWMEKIRQIFSYLLRLFIILVITVFFGFSFFWFWKFYRNSFRLKGAQSSRKGGKGYVNSIPPPENPETLFAMAERFFCEGNLREAWAACLAGCLSAYSLHYSLSFPAEATEYGCFNLVRQTLPGEAERFGDLVQCWILFAYGGKAPAGGAFERALNFGRSLGKPDSTADGVIL